MVCPYHALVAAAGLGSASGSGSGSGSGSAPAAQPPAVSLSALLRESTAATHRAIERSPGVRALVSGSSSGDNTDEGGGSAAEGLQRRDYLRWLIMLAAVYGTLEVVLQEQQQQGQQQQASSAAPAPAPLAPLFTSQHLLPILARLAPLLDDIHAHAAQLETESGITLTDLADEQALWDDTPAISHARNELLAAFALFLPSPSSSSCSSMTVQTLVYALTPTQVHATLAYIRRLRATSKSNSSLHPARLLAHIYVRYMGDLSGGQHIAKRAYARWPIPAASAATPPAIIPGSHGFVSYAFAQDQWDSLNGENDAALQRGKNKLKVEVALKNQIRQALDDSIITGSHDAHTREAVSAVVCDEANAAFELSACLFDALLDVEPPAHLLHSAESTDRTADEHLFLALDPDRTPRELPLTRTNSDDGLSVSSSSSASSASTPSDETAHAAPLTLLHTPAQLAHYHSPSSLVGVVMKAAHRSSSSSSGAGNGNSSLLAGAATLGAALLAIGILFVGRQTLLFLPVSSIDSAASSTVATAIVGAA
ncbi:hypothetical protein OC844_007770 [Tilletia horrida]|nr:hypothetical protein OC844_007770 [Tilletia horrida]